MKFGDTLKILILAWACPVVLVVIIHLFTPDPKQPKGSFPSITFVPSSIQVVEKKESRGADYFELWLHHPDGRSYFHRDPNPEPISTLKKKIPLGASLKTIYSPTQEGNVLLEIQTADIEDEPALSFDTKMGEYAFKRRVVNILAGVWFTLGTLFFMAARRSGKVEADPA
ncbi:MAG TPA: hypothetical protein VGE39_03795 [Prosthecobacter sp.]